MVRRRVGAAEEIYDRIVSRLLAHIRNLGHGAMTALTRKIDVGAKHFYQLQSDSRPFRLIKLLEAMQELGISWYDLAGPGREPTAHDSTPIPIVTRSRKLLEQGVTEETDGRGVSDLVQQLDDLRYTDTAEAARLAEAALEDFHSASAHAVLLGVWGSAQRQESRLEQASSALAEAFRISARLGRPEVIGNIRQRRASLFAAEGDFQRAHDESALSIAYHLAGDNRGGAGEAMADQGRYLWYLRRFQMAKTVLRSSLAWIPEESLRHRLSVHGNLSFTYWELGRLSEAEEHARIAIQLSEGGFRLLTGKLLLLKASVLAHSGDYSGAARQAKASFDTFEYYNLDRAVAGLAWVSLLSKAGKPAIATAVARSMVVLLEHLATSKIAHSVITELVNLGFRNELCELELSRLRTKICAAQGVTVGQLGLLEGPGPGTAPGKDEY